MATHKSPSSSTCFRFSSSQNMAARAFFGDDARILVFQRFRGMVELEVFFEEEQDGHLLFFFFSLSSLFFGC